MIDGDGSTQGVRTERGTLAVRATESGSYAVMLSDQSQINVSASVPNKSEITGWTLSVETWEPGTEVRRSEEDLFGVHTVNSTTLTAHRTIQTTLDTLAPWDAIEAIGKDISGIGTYTATFRWNASEADGALLDFGDTLVGTMIIQMNGQSLNVNWMHPIVDVGRYLQDGENTITLVYRSSIGNAALAEKIPCNGVNLASWWNLDSKRQSYGPTQAVLIPYVICEAS